MSAVLLSCYIAQMQGLVEAEKPAANWRTQHRKLAELAALACERMERDEKLKERP